MTLVSREHAVSTAEQQGLNEQGIYMAGYAADAANVSPLKLPIEWKELAIRLAGHSKYDIGADGFHGMQITTSIATVFREKHSTGSAQAESGFTPEGATGKTVGLSYSAEANL